MRIAIVGTGISGLTAAYLLHKQHEIVVYEGSDQPGGHTATIDAEIDGITHSVDTGFIVFNDWNYPNFTRLMDRIGVSSKPAEMGFSVTSRHNNRNRRDELEYCGRNLCSLFADRAQIFNPAFYGMLKDIVRFNRNAKADLLKCSINKSMGLGEYLQRKRYGRYFFDFYLYPMASAIWSAPTTLIEDFNALFFLNFYQNHGLLSINQRPQWRVIENGSSSYIKPLSTGFKNRIRVRNPVTTVRRNINDVGVTTNGIEEKYDQVVFACHSDQALNLLLDPTTDEQSILGAIPYQNNSVVLHTDPNLLPRRKRAWASWNYLLDGNESNRPVLTYYMNMLQGISSKQPICVSVNADQYINPGKVIKSFNYSHPQFDNSSAAAQRIRHHISGINRSWYCGAYWGNGFHEDGVVSAIAVSDALGGDAL